METGEAREEKGGNWRTVLQPVAGQVVPWHSGHCPRGIVVPAYFLTSLGFQVAAG